MCDHRPHTGPTPAPRRLETLQYNLSVWLHDGRRPVPVHPALPQHHDAPLHRRVAWQGDVLVRGRPRTCPRHPVLLPGPAPGQRRAVSPRRLGAPFEHRLEGVYGRRIGVGGEVATRVPEPRRGVDHRAACRVHRLPTLA